ncbi:MAG: hypothetical protein H6662_17200 [Ardenticatenaceae bacterium]|nr:hypothetical protein [Anaerolineales bacterium]MCB8923327.1 hypothetical protein [Ardenticatenaceae bacterium]MCB9004673.1 hypothetical protein [Ardenticatenaceae bacterium]
MSSKRYGHVINLDLFTDSYRVTGRAVVGAGGIHAALADPNSDFLELEDAYISRIIKPGEIITSYALVAFRKDNINFIVLQDRRDGVPVGTQHGRSVFTRGRAVSTFLTVPSFEIKGDIHHDGQLSPRAVLVHSMGRFQPIFEATASASLYPDISYSGDLILVQKERIGIFCLQSNK